jgi:hypothetical protein
MSIVERDVFRVEARKNVGVYRGGKVCHDVGGRSGYMVQLSRMSRKVSTRGPRSYCNRSQGHMTWYIIVHGKIRVPRWELDIHIKRFTRI